MKISRRDFLKWAVAASAAIKVELDFDKLNSVLAADTDPPVIWLQGSGCTGCGVSLLNVTNPTTIDDVLTNKLSMKFNTDIMAAAGEDAMTALENTANTYKGSFILVIEGAIPTGASGKYCVIGEKAGVPMTMQQAVLKYAPMAKYIIAAGTCASFGGVSAATPNDATNVSVTTALNGVTTGPIINLPSCPVHPTVLVQVIVDLILTGAPALDGSKRPLDYYGGLVHDSCPRNGLAHATPGTVGCYYDCGCNGPSTYFACPSLKWNNGANWCINTNNPCMGCANPSFPTNPLNII